MSQGAASLSGGLDDIRSERPRLAAFTITGETHAVVNNLLYSKQEFTVFEFVLSEVFFLCVCVFLLLFFFTIKYTFRGNLKTTTTATNISVL